MSFKLNVKPVFAAVVMASVSFLGAPIASAESVLRLRMDGDVQQLDPIWTTAFAVRDMGYLIWDTLFAMDGDYEIQPQMVDEFTISEDETVYTLTLREGLAWHDGKPVTSEDCIASLQRWMKKDQLGQILYDHLEMMEAVDDRTFKIILSEPWSLTLAALGKPSSNVPFMMPKRLAQTPADEPISEYIGSGPFVFKQDEWVPGSKMVFVKNENYIPRDEPLSLMAGGRTANVDRIERIHIPDDLSAANALINGEIDYLASVTPDMFPAVEASDNARLFVRDPLGRNINVVLNTTQPPLDDMRIRQAVQLALSQEEYVQGLFGDKDEYYQICGAIFFCGGPYESEVGSERVLRQDFDAAQELLEEAGYNGTPLLIIHPTDTLEQDIEGTILVQSLRKAGFEVEDFATDMATYVTRRANKGSVDEGGWHIFTTSWGGLDQMTPITNVFVTGACEDAWFGWPCDEQLQQLREAFFAASSEEERKSVAVDIQARVMEFVTYVPMGQLYPPIGISKNLKGVEQGPVHTFWGISKNKE